MYYRQASFAGDLGSVVLIVALIALFVMVWIVCFVIRTFIKHYKKKALWIALGVCLAICIASILLALSVNKSAGMVSVVGIAILVITCIAVDMHNRDTLLPEHADLKQQILHSPWWGESDETAAAAA